MTWRRWLRGEDVSLTDVSITDVSNTDVSITDDPITDADSLTRFVDAARTSLAYEPMIGDPSLADRAALYLRYGNDPGTVTALANAVRQWSSKSPAEVIAARVVLYEELGRVPADVGLRWAMLVSAWTDVGQRGSTLTLAPVAGGAWAECLLADIARTFRGADQGARPPVSMATLDAIVVAGGGRSGEVLDAAFGRDPARAHRDVSTVRTLLRDLPGYREAVAAHAGRLNAIALLDGRGRDAVLEMLAPLSGTDLAPFADFLAACVTADSTATAIAAEAAASRCASVPMAEALKRVAVDGATSRQLRALRTLWKLGATDADRAWALEFVATATSAAAKALAREWVSSGSAPTSSQPRDDTVVPGGGGTNATDPQGVRSDVGGGTVHGATGRRTSTSSRRPINQWRTELTPDLTAALTALRADLDSVFDAEAQRLRATGHGALVARAAEIVKLDDSAMRRLEDAIVTGRARSGGVRLPRPWDMVTETLARFGAHPGVGIPAVLIALTFFDRLVESGSRGLTRTAIAAIDAMHSSTGDPDLLTLARLLDDLGHRGRDLVFDAYCLPWRGLGREWPSTQVAPFVTANLDRFLAGLADGESYSVDPTAPYHALATLDVLPPDVADTLYRVALGTAARNRDLAQDVLARDPDCRARIRTAVRAGSADGRIVAARWLARRAGDDPPASDCAPDIAVLEEAYAAERTDRVRQALLDALAALGRPPQLYLNRDTLADEVAKSRKPPPRELNWLDWETLPTVRWRRDDDAGKDMSANTVSTVGVETLSWLVASAVRHKTPEPSVALRYYCALFDPDDLARLADHLLDSWLSLGSISSKGVLAVCATGHSVNAARLAEHYIRTHYGNRVAHCRALLVMLGWIEQPNAVQVLLGISTRFRTRSIQQEATTQVQALAERRSWTADELADRTVPDGGLGAGGRLVLSYGPRQFSARVGPKLTLVLQDSAGKVIKSLPSPRIDDDPDAVTEAKRALSLARKTVKSTVAVQRGRLYEAMCVGRAWPADQWREYIHGHPIVGLLTERLIWSARPADTPPGAESVIFRPLDDGTLTDVDDEEVTVDDAWQISLVHPGQLDADTAASWQEHLTDYEVPTLFDQLSSPPTVTIDDAATSVDDYTGHLIDTFALRTAATRHGYTRGPAGDGGLVDRYEKRFLSSGLTAVMRISGYELPDENVTVALQSLHFTRIDGGTVVRVADVPTVLLREVVRDVETIAASGTGYDDHWRQKVLYA